MPFLADLHIHSHFSRATSGECRPGPLAAVAARKGLTVVGTGDFTHAGWRAELREELVEAEEGLYRLRDAAGPAAGVRFLVTGEISCIYKQDGRTRKIHHLVLLPSLEAADKVAGSLEDRGANLRADGRPITGFDSRTLLGLILEAEPEAILIPAHIWTPHFSLFGANSGFDALEECFGDLSAEVTAYETGLSSDPPMNWRLSALDRLRLVSNSDAHSPEKLGREAVEFEAELSYMGLAAALRGKEGRVAGTIEFFPEEGKYHYDGHRNCGVCWHPRETAAAGGLCRVCGRPVTVGVLHRACALADRPEGFRPEGAPPYVSLVSLMQIAADALDAGLGSRRVEEVCRRLVEEMGPEIPLLREGDLGGIADLGGALVAEGVRRVRAGEVRYRPGYDGAYGELTIFQPEERRYFAGQAALFSLPGADLPAERRKLELPAGTGAGESAAALAAEDAAAWPAGDPLHGLDGAQAEAAAAPEGPVIVQAGPGAGKTRTLVRRIACLIGRGVGPENIAAITFTHRAADEMRRRLAGFLGEVAGRVFVGTFHRFCLDLLTKSSGAPPLVLDQREAAAILAEAAPRGRGEGSCSPDDISRLKSRGLRPGDAGVPAEAAKAYRLYQERLRELGACDYDDLLLGALEVLEAGGEAARAAKERAAHLLVDEFQDVNAVQYRLVKALAGDGAGLFVIGDPDQAIYGFRGADHRFFTALSDDFPRARCFVLDRNYRSTGSVTAAARALMGRAAATEEGPAGQRPRYISVHGPRAEAKVLVREIERLVGGTGMLSADGQSGRRPAKTYSLGEMAVLFRTARQAVPLEEALLAEGIPYRALGQRTILEDPSVREALDILRYLDRPTDLRFLIALRETRFNPGAAPLAAITGFARANCCPYAAAAAELLRLGQFTIDAHGRIQGLLDLVEELRGMAAASTAAADLLLRAAPGGGDEPPRVLTQVARAAAGRPLAEFLFRLGGGPEGDQERREGDMRRGEGVSLMTMHAAKGLEFPVVFVAGLEDGVVPWRGADDDEELAEERRLLYVAMTRAAEVLILLGPPDGSGSRAPSRFLADLPEELLAREGARPRKVRAEQKGLF
ncbi:MAG: UvrD-helicase domain-containing protein, partial [Patescibacteria group bacterium]